MLYKVDSHPGWSDLLADVTSVIAGSVAAAAANVNPLTATPSAAAANGLTADGSGSLPATPAKGSPGGPGGAAAAAPAAEMQLPYNLPYSGQHPPMPPPPPPPPRQSPGSGGAARPNIRTLSAPEQLHLQQLQQSASKAAAGGQLGGGAGGLLYAPPTPARSASLALAMPGGDALDSLMGLDGRQAQQQQQQQQQQKGGQQGQQQQLQQQQQQQRPDPSLLISLLGSHPQLAASLQQNPQLLNSILHFNGGAGGQGQGQVQGASGAASTSGASAADGAGTPVTPPSPGGYDVPYGGGGAAASGRTGNGQSILTEYGSGGVAFSPDGSASFLYGSPRPAPPPPMPSPPSAASTPGRPAWASPSPGGNAAAAAIGGGFGSLLGDRLLSGELAAGGGGAAASGLDAFHALMGGAAGAGPAAVGGAAAVGSSAAAAGMLLGLQGTDPLGTGYSCLMFEELSPLVREKIQSVLDTCGPHIKVGHNQDIPFPAIL